MQTNQLLLLSATSLARLIRDGEVSSEEVVEAHIRRIRAVNPSLNAVVAPRFEQAAREARRADGLLRAGGDRRGLPSLHGVPCTVKEAIALEGSPFTSGSSYRRGVVAGEDSTAVARVRAAGAIPLGVTNISEMCMWMESDNVIYGRTGNPYDPSRTCGGSSGGEGAIVGAGGSPVGIGADIGGSIRMPAFFCGVFGHKPTGGLVPLTGHYPGSTGGRLRMCTIGPLCRRAEDLLPLLRIMAGPDGVDPTVAPTPPLPAHPPEAFKGARVLLCEGLGGWTSPVDPELAQAIRRVGRIFEERGAHVEPWTSRLTRKALQIWTATIELAGEQPFHHVIGEGKPPHLLAEWLHLLLGRPNHTFPALALASLEKLVERVPRGGLKSLQRDGQRLREEIESQVGKGGLLLVPPHPRPAPRHKAVMRTPFDWIYTGLFNALELPVTAAPMGLSGEGLPLGVQLVAARFSDAVSIAGAEILEQEAGGWTPPGELWQ